MENICYISFPGNVVLVPYMLLVHDQRADGESKEKINKCKTEQIEGELGRSRVCE